MGRTVGLASGALILGALLANGCGATSGPPSPPPPAASPAPSSAMTPERGVATAAATAPSAARLQEYAAPADSRPHDVAPALDGGVWYTAQGQGALGYLDPRSGETRQIALGAGSAPHGVIVATDGSAWITDGGLNAIVRVDARTTAVTRYPLPAGRGNANLNTAVFDRNGVLWFTGQNGIYGRLDPRVGSIEVFDAPRGRGPYGITATRNGDVYYASLAGNHIARVDISTGAATVLEPPTRGQGARRVWADSRDRIWVSEWNAGQLARYDPPSAPGADPTAGSWREWKLPGVNPSAYAVYVDDRDMVWVSDFGGNAIWQFDPTAEAFTQHALPSPNANVRQILGRPGEVWLPESGLDRIAVLRSRG